MATTLISDADYDRAELANMKEQSQLIVQSLVSSATVSAQFTFRPLRAADVAGNTPGYLTNPNALSANTYAAAYSNVTPAQNQCFCIWGIELELSAPLIDEITILVGADTVAILPLGAIKAPTAGTTPQRGWIDNPIFVGPQIPFTVNLLSGTGQTQSTEKWNLVGTVGEPMSLKVSGQQQQNEYWAMGASLMAKARAQKAARNAAA